MLPINRSRSQSRTGSPWSFPGFSYILITGIDYSDSRRKPQVIGKLVMVAILTAFCIFILKQSPGFGGPGMVLS
ncbi:hypothetical protein BHE74_00049902 [Ensete ventricosum]|uniref:Uncharacterized protein n=1 Tax=Ensete ventricosum TaxID=4639 RepID=A0A444ESC9_ENSVE|nr:hypothetical protein B296_00039462 [Ensete ventricosum]RWW13281.1 hypothetical protein GW17_00023018 [Ensete ventricosum]RWW44344.1 hypothetical protein BHE74_00049902 [Ensete ventricosum]RZR70556.1 hypothetical protein BHM03_00000433 [Ensete ventricosum]